jgi:hypothetical protein
MGVSETESIFIAKLMRKNMDLISFPSFSNGPTRFLGMQEFFEVSKVLSWEHWI